MGASEKDGVKAIEVWGCRHGIGTLSGTTYKTKQAAEAMVACLNEHPDMQGWVVVKVRELWLERLTPNGSEWILGHRQVIEQ